MTLKEFIHDSFVMPQPWEHARIASRWEVWATLAWNYLIVLLMLALIAYAVIRLLGGAI